MNKKIPPSKLKTAPKTNTNALTSAAIRLINMMPNCAAYRINNVGVWDEAKKVHRKSNTQKGIADILCCMNGMFVALEVKVGTDKQSTDQKIFEQEIKLSKGMYVIIKDIDDLTKFSTEWQEKIRQQKRIESVIL
jgi:hypothetical protein